MTIRELLSDKSKWCRKYAALDSKHCPVGPNDPSACQWCFIGAIHKCYDWNRSQDIERKLYQILRDSIGEYNDTHTYEEVIALAERLGI